MKKAIIALVVLVLAAAASIGTFLAVKGKDDKKKQEASKVLAENELFSFDAHSATKIVFSKGSESYTAEKNEEDAWSLSGSEFALDQDYCNLICTYLSDLTAETSYGEITDEKLDMYGLNDTDTIEITEPGGTHTIHIGDPAPMNDYYYVTVDGRPNVYAIEYMRGSVLKLDRLLLKDKMLLPYTLYDLNEVILKRDGENVLDLVLDPDSQNWSLTDEYSDLQSDTTAITARLNSLVRLESVEMLDEKLDDLSKYGFDKPYAEMTVKAIDGTERNISFSINDDYPGYCIALLEDGQVELFNKSDLSIINALPYDFIIKDYRTANAASTKQLKLKYGEIDAAFDIDTENSECTANGKKISLETTENYVAFDNFFKAASIFKLTGTDIEAEPELKDPALTAEFTLKEGDPLKIELVKGEGTIYYVFRNGKYIGGYVDETMLRGRNSLSEFYVKFSKTAGF